MPAKLVLGLEYPKDKKLLILNYKNILKN